MFIQKYQKTDPPYTPSRLDGGAFITTELRKYCVKVKTILDVGCGKLYLLNVLNNLPFKGTYFGIDPSVKIRRVEKLGKYIIEKGNIHSFKSGKKYDLITCLWVLEHIKKDKQAVFKMSKLLSKNGLLIIAVPSIWTWPFEFGRHGFHYYRLKQLKNYFPNKELVIMSEYSSGGILGFLFMIIYNWPRFVILIVISPLYITLFMLGLTKLTWPEFSKKVIAITWYWYHNRPALLGLHNWVVRSIVKIDNIFKIFPQSYIVVMQKI